MGHKKGLKIWQNRFRIQPYLQTDPQPTAKETQFVEL